MSDDSQKDRFLGNFILSGIVIGIIIASTVYLITHRIEASLGFIAGGIISLINFKWMSMSVLHRFYNSSSKSLSGLGSARQYTFRLIIIAATVILFIKTTNLDIIAMVSGLFLVQITIFLWQIPKNIIYFSLMKKKAGSAGAAGSISTIDTKHVSVKDGDYEQKK